MKSPQSNAIYSMRLREHATSTFAQISKLSGTVRVTGSGQQADTGPLLQQKQAQSSWTTVVRAQVSAQPLSDHITAWITGSSRNKRPETSKMRYLDFSRKANSDTGHRFCHRTHGLVMRIPKSCLKWTGLRLSRHCLWAAMSTQSNATNTF